jgi:hypothetical protein
LRMALTSGLRLSPLTEHSLSSRDWRFLIALTPFSTILSHASSGETGGEGGVGRKATLTAMMHSARHCEITHQAALALCGCHSRHSVHIDQCYCITHSRSNFRRHSQIQ